MAAESKTSDIQVHPLDGIPFSATTVLARTVNYGIPGTVACLLKKGCDPNTPILGKRHVYPLMVASYIKCKRNRLEIFKALLKYGADPSLTDARGRSSVMYACALSLKDEVELMVKDCDYNLNATDMYGDTALHMCTKAGDTDTLGVLLREMQRYRIDISVQNNSRLTPLSLALLHRNVECARMLHEAGGFPRLSQLQFSRLLPATPPHSSSSAIGHTRSSIFNSSAKSLSYNRPRPRPSTTPMTTKEHNSRLLASRKESSITRQLLLDNPKYHVHEKTSPQKEKHQDEKDITSVHFRPVTSIECINALLSSSMFRRSTSPAFCLPSREVVELDAQWLATINEYKSKKGSYEDIFPPLQKAHHVSFKTAAKKILSSTRVSSSSSSCRSSASSLTSTLHKAKRPTNSPRFRFKVPVSHMNDICDV